MNISENVNEIEKASLIQTNDKSRFNLSTMLGLPIIDPEFVVNEISYKFKTIAERNAFSLVSLVSNIKEQKFDKVTSFNSNSRSAYADEINPEHTLTYIDNVYNQWKNIADKYGVKISSDIVAQKESIVQDFKDFSQNFEDYRTFISKYKIIEPLYIGNRHNAEEALFFKQELDDLCEQYSKLLTNETAALFFNNQTGYGVNEEDCEIPKIFSRLTKVIQEMRKEIQQQKPEALATMSSKFTLSQQVSLNDITSFLNIKNFEDNIKVQVQLTSSQNISGFILFKDGSAAAKHRNGPYETITVDEISAVTHELIKSTIDYKFRKKPKIGKFLKDKYDEDGGFFNEVDVVMNTYLNNEAILKNMKFDISQLQDKSFEGIDDAMNASINNYKLERYANTILSNKYKELLTPEAMSNFKMLYESKVSESELQDLIGKKLAAIKTTQEFEQYLQKVVNQYNGFTPEALTKKLKNMNIEPILSDNDVYVFEVNTFEDSKTLGSASWCIARHEQYFNTYTGYGKRQFFIYDFNKSDKNNESMIGITLEKTGIFNTQHLKNDDYVSPTDFLIDIQKQLILKEVDKYVLDDSMKKQLGIHEEIVEVNPNNKKTIKASI